MKEFIIKRSRNRYSIREDGVLFSNYTYIRGKRVDKRVKKAILHSNPKSISSHVEIYIEAKLKRVSMIKLMEEYFKLKTPDDNHRYIPFYIDGDNLNNSVDNIGYKILLNKDWRFTPKITHKGRKVISKRCCNCGDTKRVSEFQLLSKSNTYTNYCETCRNIQNYKRIKSDTNKYKQHTERSSKFRYSEKGKEYYGAYKKPYDDNYREGIKDGYLNNLIKRRGLNPDTFNEEMKDVLKLSVMIDRHIKSIKL